MSESKTPEIRKETIFQAEIQNVWRAVATSQGIESWFMPNDFKAELGYEFTIQSPFGPTPCKVLEIESPNHLLFSWGDFGWNVSIDLKEAGTQTEFSLVHSGWGEPDEILPGSNKSSLETRNIMDNGWDSLIEEKLRHVVED